MSKEDVRKAIELTVATLHADGESTQVDEDPWTPENAITPPEDLDNLAALSKVSRLRRSCIAAVVQNTVGLGYTLGVRDGHEEEVSEIAAETRQATAALNELARRDKRLKRPSFGRLMRAVQWDKYECGNGYIEVSRNRLTGQPSGLFHAPGKRIRRASDRDGWIMLERANELNSAVRFYDFGDKVQYDADGLPTNKLQANAGKRWEVNELIPMQLYTSESRDYGLPPDSQLAIDYLGDKLAGDTNVSFFGAQGVPPTVIFVQGQESEEGETVKIEVPPEFVRKVEDALRSGGITSRSRVAIIGVPSGFEAKVENLAVTSERDMGFISYRGDNRRATLAAYRLSPVFVADIEDAGKYTAEVERAITKEQVFDPEQHEVAELLDLTIIGELFPHLSIGFEGLAIKDDLAQRESANDLADRGHITNGEYRDAHDFPRLAEAKHPGPLSDEEKIQGLVPQGWNAQLMAPLPVPTQPGAAGSPAVPTREPGLHKRLEDDIAAEFDAAVAEAVDVIHEINPAAALEAVVVEKVGDAITITRRPSNGKVSR